MSTAAAWDTLPVQSPTSRPRLVVIDGGAAEEAGRPAALVVPRWVRLALTLSVAAVLVTMLLGVGGAGAGPGFDWRRWLPGDPTVSAFRPGVTRRRGNQAD